MMKGGKKRIQGKKGPRKPALPLYFEPPRTRTAVLAFSGVYSAEAESSAGGGHYHFFKINSAYDIDAAYGSVAVPGFAEYGAFFQNYRVISARVKLEAAVSGMTTGSICEVSLVPNGNGLSLPAQAQTWPVQYNAVTGTICNSNEGAGRLLRLDKTFDLAKLFNVTPQQFRSDFDFSAGVTQNPTRVMYLAVCFRSAGSSTVAVLSYKLTVSMRIEFFVPTLLQT